VLHLWQQIVHPIVRNFECKIVRIDGPTLQHTNYDVEVQCNDFITVLINDIISRIKAKYHQKHNFIPITISEYILLDKFKHVYP
jgi:hypothetical protein